MGYLGRRDPCQVVRVIREYDGLGPERFFSAHVEADVADEKAMSELFDAVQRVSVRGTFVVDQQAARRIRSGGSIVNVASSMVRAAPPELSVYAASKSAVAALTRILAKKRRGRDITVNAVAPGPTATPAFLASTPADEQKELAALPPLERLGSSDDIAAVVSFLAGPGGRWVNGQIVYANGGFV